MKKRLGLYCAKLHVGIWNTFDFVKKLSSSCLSFLKESILPSTIPTPSPFLSRQIHLFHLFLSCSHPCNAFRGFSHYTCVGHLSMVRVQMHHKLRPKIESSWTSWGGHTARLLPTTAVFQCIPAYFHHCVLWISNYKHLFLWTWMKLIGTILYENEHNLDWSVT